MTTAVSKRFMALTAGGKLSRAAADPAAVLHGACYMLHTARCASFSTSAAAGDCRTLRSQSVKQLDLSARCPLQASLDSSSGRKMHVDAIEIRCATLAILHVSSLSHLPLISYPFPVHSVAAPQLTSFVLINCKLFLLFLSRSHGSARLVPQHRLQQQMVNKRLTNAQIR